jgi:hypothetical protein
MDTQGIRSASVDPAVALADRLRQECRAAIVETSEQPHGITIRLMIPRRGLAPMKRVRRDLWMSHVSSSVRSRRAHAAQVRRRVEMQREALDRSRALAERNRLSLRHRTSA